MNFGMFFVLYAQPEFGEFNGSAMWMRWAIPRRGNHRLNHRMCHSRTIRLCRITLQPHSITMIQAKTVTTVFKAKRNHVLTIRMFRKIHTTTRIATMLHRMQINQHNIHPHQLLQRQFSIQTVHRIQTAARKTAFPANFPCYSNRWCRTWRCNMDNVWLIRASNWSKQISKNMYQWHGSNTILPSITITWWKSWFCCCSHSLIG